MTRTLKKLKKIKKLDSSPSRLTCKICDLIMISGYPVKSILIKTIKLNYQKIQCQRIKLKKKLKKKQKKRFDEIKMLTQDNYH